MSSTSTSDTTSSGTVARVALLLRVLAEADGDASLSEVAEKMKLPPSTTHRLLHLLLDEGFVERGQTPRTYRAGLEFLRVGGLVSARADLSTVAHSFMQAVVEACDEACMLSVYVPRTGTSMITKVIYGSHPLRYEAVLYQPSSLVWGATGRGILAFLPDEVRDVIIEAEGPSPADPRKPVKAAQVRRELEQVRRQGYAHTRGQKIPGAVGMSAPVFNAGGVVAALCITVPDTRFQESMEARFSHTLVQQAARFSAALGWRGVAKAA
ncbi:MAG TPA: IclR family transcriptional regulator [Ramlibacter sp.]|nr:IclR family transcriptional regulator [Ramlibacter sp.]